jgi:hypothetical protein
VKQVPLGRQKAPLVTGQGPGEGRRRPQAGEGIEEGARWHRTGLLV